MQTQSDRATTGGGAQTSAASLGSTDDTNIMINPRMMIEAVSQAGAPERAAQQGPSVETPTPTAVRWADPDGQRLVRVVGGPLIADRQFIGIMTSGTARQLAAALLVAAGQAEELERDVPRPRPVR